MHASISKSFTVAKLPWKPPRYAGRYLSVPNSCHLAINGDGTAVCTLEKEREFALWDTTTGERIESFPALQAAFVGTETLACLLNQIVRIIDVPEWRELSKIKIKECSGQEFEVSNRGELVASTCCRDTGATVVWLVFSRLGHQFDFQHGTSGYCATFTHDENRLIIGDDEGIWQWTMADDKKQFIDCLPAACGAHGRRPLTTINGLIVSDASDLAACVTSLDIQIVDLVSAEAVQRLQKPDIEGAVNLVGFIDTSVVGVTPHAIICWSATTGEIVSSLLQEVEIVSAAMSQRKQLAIRYANGDVVIFEFG